ncbi:hypothetical protein Tco_1045784 [Tanacetum coccineum]|uniref:Reverse transcriptase Ty1/copia-type domain-containing protein n=1 Tax=Tanacetum coccineum TaxID=301880 RepID=A0ABQ5GUA8_9ASTR
MMSDDNTLGLSPQQQMTFDHNSSNLAPQRHKASDYDNSDPAPQLRKTSVHNNTKLGIQDHNNEHFSSTMVLEVVPSADNTYPSLQELKLLLCLMYEEYFNGGNQGVPSAELGIQDHNNEPSSSTLVPEVVPSTDNTDPSLQELELLFSPMYEEYFNGGNQGVSKSSNVSNLQQQQDTLPTLNVQPTSVPSTPTTNVNVEDNNNQAVNVEFEVDEFINPFCTPFKVVMEEQKDEDNTVIRNKSRLVAKGYHQEEGLQVYQSPRGIFINQSKYTLDILKMHGMEKCDNIGTPMATQPKLDADLSRTPVDQTKYHSMIGSLMYLTSSRPYLVHATCYCTRYQARPTEKHLKKVKKIFRYLKKTTNMGLWYPKDSGDKLVSWSSKKQDCTAMSTAEAEYVALSASCTQVLWMRTQLTDYGFHFSKIPMYFDSKSSIAILWNPLADMFMKSLSKERFEYLVGRLGMRCLTLAELDVQANESA